MENAPSFVTHTEPIEDNLNDLALLAQALGHPHRIAIIQYLLRNPGCICGKIVDELPLAQSTVSQHLKKLKDAGWIRAETDGPKTCYCLKPGAVRRFADMVEQLSIKSGGS
jgi:ArsR family transcriptional regulator